MIINAPRITPRIKLTPSERRAVRHYYALFVSDRPETPRGQIWADACRHVFFRQRLSADVKAYKRRSAAAKRGWKARKESNR